MQVGQRVEYQTGYGCYGTGRIVAIDEAKEVLIVADDEDHSLWRGLMDFANPLVQ